MHPCEPEGKLCWPQEKKGAGALGFWGIRFDVAYHPQRTKKKNQKRILKKKNKHLQLNLLGHEKKKCYVLAPPAPIEKGDNLQLLQVAKRNNFPHLLVNLGKLQSLTSAQRREIRVALSAVR